MPKVKQVLVYSTSTCPYCDLLKNWLDEKKVSYEVVNLSENPARGQELIQKTGQMGVPVSIVSFDDDTEKVVIGFDQQQLTQILSL